MSCYLRRVKDILDEAEIEVTPGNRKKIDQVIHKAVEVAYKDCPTAWKKVKQEIMGDQQRRADLSRSLSRLPFEVEVCFLNRQNCPQLSFSEPRKYARPHQHHGSSECRIPH